MRHSGVQWASRRSGATPSSHRERVGREQQAAAGYDHVAQLVDPLERCARGAPARDREGHVHGSVLRDLQAGERVPSAPRARYRRRCPGEPALLGPGLRRRRRAARRRACPRAGGPRARSGSSASHAVPEPLGHRRVAEARARRGRPPAGPAAMPPARARSSPSTRRAPAACPGSVRMPRRSRSDVL